MLLPRHLAPPPYPSPRMEHLPGRPEVDVAQDLKGRPVALASLRHRCGERQQANTRHLVGVLPGGGGVVE